MAPSVVMDKGHFRFLGEKNYCFFLIYIYIYAFYNYQFYCYMNDFVFNLSTVVSACVQWGPLIGHAVVLAKTGFATSVSSTYSP